MKTAVATKPAAKSPSFAEGLRLDFLNADMQEFAPGILKVQQRPPSPLPRIVLYAMLALFGVAVLWIIFGRLDIVAVAQGKLIPQTYVKIVQPAEAGVVDSILVTEGQAVVAGQVLMRMDTKLADADSKTVRTDYQSRDLQLRRIDAELADQPLKRKADDNAALFHQVESQYRANREAYQGALDQETEQLKKAREDIAGAQEALAKLQQVLPMYRTYEQAYGQLATEGFVGELEASDRHRERIEKEQDLRTQSYNVASLQASIAQSEKRLAQITSTYRQQLQQERVEVLSQYQRLEQDLAKQEYKNTLLELRAPQAGIIKDLATHTPRTVVSPGTVLMTLVPQDEHLQAEVWIENEDAGFVSAQQPVKIKILAYRFQKYGMVDGSVTNIGADASDQQTAEGKAPAQPARYRALVSLKEQTLSADSEQFALTAGMQVTAEVKLGTRTILEYLLSPVQRAFHEAGRER